jgi:hypothetical protein
MGFECCCMWIDLEGVRCWMCCTIYANEANINYSVECIDSQGLHSYRFEMTSRVYSSGCIDSGLNFRVYDARCIEFWDEPSCMYWNMGLTMLYVLIHYINCKCYVYRFTRFRAHTEITVLMYRTWGQHLGALFCICGHIKRKQSPNS